MPHHPQQPLRPQPESAPCGHARRRIHLAVGDDVCPHRCAPELSRTPRHATTRRGCEPLMTPTSPPARHRIPQQPLSGATRHITRHTASPKSTENKYCCPGKHSQQGHNMFILNYREFGIRKCILSACKWLRYSSSPNLGEVARRAGGVCDNTLVGNCLLLTHAPALRAPPLTQRETY